MKNNTHLFQQKYYQITAVFLLICLLFLATNTVSAANTTTTIIQDSIDSASSGDVVTIPPGTYAETVIIDKPLTLRGSGTGTNPAVDTILEGTTIVNKSGIVVNTNVTHVTIENLRVQHYDYSGIYASGQNNHLTVQNVAVDSNGRSGTSDAGLYINGSVDTVVINAVSATNNQTRGIVIWNGYKSNITITNNTASNNGCCGIELQDGTASGVTISGNTSQNNGDSGLSAIGLTSGAGANLITNNTVINNGRFGIEIKNPNGTGATTDDGSIVVQNNLVSITPSATMNIRDHAGIAIFRRSFTEDNPEGYVDIPTGVVVRSNNISGYTHQNANRSESEGFGLVIEGINHTVTNNIISGNDIGIQEQGGNHPHANYVFNDEGDGNQSDGYSANYFGRGNAPTACASTMSNNILSNSTNLRQNVASATGVVTNTDTGEIFCTIQAAINDSDTLDEHTLSLEASTYAEEVHVTKSVTITGASTATTILNPTKNTSANNSETDGWWLVDENKELHLHNMTFNGSGYLISHAIHHKGKGSITNVDFTEIKYNPGINYRGIALAARGTGPVYVTHVNMSEIGRIGIHFRGSGVNGSIVDNLTYTGKGVGTFLDYGVEFGWGAQGTVQNSQISNIHGIAGDTSTSACILATTYYGAGTQATIINSSLSDCATAVAIGYNDADTTVTVVKGNRITNVEQVFATTSTNNQLTAYANNITDFTDGGLFEALGTINARHNWWDTHETKPIGVDADSWSYRLGAPVNTWADGASSVSLADSKGGTATLQEAIGYSGGGTAVLISHGRAETVAEAPFGKAIAADIDDNQCSDFYDAFVINGNDNYALALPVDATTACGATDNKLFQFDLDGNGAPNVPDCAATSDTNCWHHISATRGTNLLTSTTIPHTQLLGTPYVAPSANNNDPTAVSLATFSAENNNVGVITAVILLLLFTLTTTFIWKRQQ